MQEAAWVVIIKGILFYDYQTQDIYEQFKDPLKNSLNIANLNQLCKGFLPQIQYEEVQNIYNHFAHFKQDNQNTEGLTFQEFELGIQSLKMQYSQQIQPQTMQLLGYLISIAISKNISLSQLQQPMDQNLFVQKAKQIIPQCFDSDIKMMYIGLCDFSQKEQLYIQLSVGTKIYQTIEIVKQEQLNQEKQEQFSSKINSNYQKTEVDERNESIRKQLQSVETPEHMLTLMKLHQQVIKKSSSFQEICRKLQGYSKQYSESVINNNNILVTEKQFQDLSHFLYPQINIKYVNIIFQSILNGQGDAELQQQMVLDLHILDEFISSNSYLNLTIQLAMEQEDVIIHQIRVLENLKEQNKKLLEKQKTMDQNIQKFKENEANLQRASLIFQDKHNKIFEESNGDTYANDLEKYEIIIKKLNDKNEGLESLVRKLNNQTQELRSELVTLKAEHSEMEYKYSIMESDYGNQVQKCEQFSVEKNVTQKSQEQILKSQKSFEETKEQMQKKILDQERELERLRTDNKIINNEKIDLQCLNLKFKNQIELISRQLNIFQFRKKVSSGGDQTGRIMDDDLSSEKQFESTTSYNTDRQQRTKNAMEQINIIQEQLEEAQQDMEDQRLQNIELCNELTKYKLQLMEIQNYSSYKKYQQEYQESQPDILVEQEELIEDLVAQNSQLILHLYK